MGRKNAIVVSEVYDCWHSRKTATAKEIGQKTTPPTKIRATTKKLQNLQSSIHIIRYYIFILMSCFEMDQHTSPMSSVFARKWGPQQNTLIITSNLYETDKKQRMFYATVQWNRFRLCRNSPICE